MFAYDDNLPSQTNLQHTIDTFLQNLKLLEINEIEFIQNLCHAMLADDRNIINFISDTLSSYPELVNAFQALCSLSFDAERKVAIEAQIREIFFNYINPLSDLIINFDKTTIKQTMDYLKNNEKLNQEEQYTNYKSGFTFKQTCKSMYFQKQSSPDESNIFYALGSAIKITSPRITHKTVEMTLRNKIAQDEIIYSLLNKDLKEIKLFKSLYQASEYARYLYHEKHLENGESAGYIPSVWSVYYIDNINNLKFSEEIVLINADQNHSTTNYSLNRCPLMVSYSNMIKESVLPLVGTVIFPKLNFAEYYLFEKVDFLKFMNDPTQNLTNNYKM